MLGFPRSWAEKVFVCYKNYHQSLEMSPYKALYGRKFRSPIHWHETSEGKILDPKEMDKVS